RKIHSAEILTILASTFCPALNCTGFTKLSSNSSAKLSSSLISSNFSLSSPIQASYPSPKLNLQSIHSLIYSASSPRGISRLRNQFAFNNNGSGAKSQFDSQF